MARREFPARVKAAVIKRATRNDVAYCEKPMCSIDGCLKNSWAKNLCRAHYAKLRCYGDATRGRTYLPTGERKRFIASAIAYEGDDCLLWPFSNNGNGYPRYSDGKKKRYAHRNVCEAVYGHPPGERAETAHSCGNGHLGCITPKHLRWATRQENIDDMRAHGTILEGEKNPRSKLTKDEVAEIRSLKGNISCRRAGMRFGVAAQTVHDIWSGRTWASNCAATS